MWNQNQFSIASLLLLTVCVALLVRWPQVWMFILVGQVLVALMCIHYLIRNIPSGIASLMKQNCRLPDGRSSRSRKQLELAATITYRNSLIVLFSIVLVPANILFWISSSSQDWFKFEVADKRLTEIFGGGFVDIPSFEVPDEVREVSWVILVIWLVFSTVLLYQGYMRSLHDLLKGAKLRAREYRLADLASLPRGKEFGGDNEKDAEQSAA